MNEAPSMVKTAVVTIISIWSKIDGLEGKLHGRDQNVTYQVEVPAGSTPTDTLEHAFCVTNADDRPRGNQVCSTTAGDIMVLDGQHYLIEGSGYHALTLAESEAIQKLTSRDTSFGYAWITRTNVLPMTEEVALNVLGQVQEKLGRTYKSKIRQAWMTGNYEIEDLKSFEGVLQRIRNVFGPSWLVRARQPRFYRADGCSGNGRICERCGQMWLDHIAPNSICPKNRVSTSTNE